MNTGKYKFLSSLQNILIILLVLTVILSITKTILHQTAYASAAPRIDAASERPVEEESIGNTLLHRVLQHVFPAGGLADDNRLELLSLKDAYLSIIDGLAIDLNNPITFVKFQFPALALYVDNKAEMAAAAMQTENNSESRPGEENNHKPVTGAGNVVSNPVEPDNDDLGEENEGIFLIDELIDSRDNSRISLEGVVKPEKIKLEEGKPQIIIYHTHGTESYKPASEDNFHTLRKQYSVIAMGEIIKAELENRGYVVIHDTTYHDYPSYNGSYTRSLSTVQQLLKDNPTVRVVVDLHRDGYNNIEKNPHIATLIRNNQVEINNEISSKMQFVIGPEAQNRKAVETFAQYVKAVSDQLYPGFSKPILLKPYGRFNQFVADHYLLLELGSNANTVEEARRAAKHFADVLAVSLKGITE